MCLVNNLSEYLANFAAVSPRILLTRAQREKVLLWWSWSPGACIVTAGRGELATITHASSLEDYLSRLPPRAIVNR